MSLRAARASDVRDLQRREVPAGVAAGVLRAACGRRSSWLRPRATRRRRARRARGRRTRRRRARGEDGWMGSRGTPSGGSATGRPRGCDRVVYRPGMMSDRERRRTHPQTLLMRLGAARLPRHEPGRDARPRPGAARRRGGRAGQPAGPARGHVRPAWDPAAAAHQHRGQLGRLAAERRPRPGPVHRPVLRRAADAALADLRPGRRRGQGRAVVHPAGSLRQQRRRRNRPGGDDAGRQHLDRGGLRTQRREPAPGPLLVAGDLQVVLRRAAGVRRLLARQRQRHRPDPAAGRAAVLRRRVAQPALSLRQPRVCASP